MPKNGPKLSIGLVYDDSLDTNDGVAQYVKTLGAWLSSQGHHVTYLVGETKTKSWSGGQIYSLAKNQKVNFNNNRMSIPYPADKKALKLVLGREKFDVLHVMMPYSPFLAQKIIKSADDKTAVVGTFHIFPANLAVKTGGKILKIIYGHSLNRFNMIISVSKPAQEYAKRSFGISSEVVPNPVELSKFQIASDKKSPLKTSLIVFLGRLVKRKGCSELIDAFSELSRIKPDARLIIAGDGPQRKDLVKKCQKLNLTQKVDFLGRISEADKPNLLAGAGIACFPSLYGESFGIVLLEAMAAGARVVLGGDNPGYRSVLGSQPKLLVDPKDTQAFTERLQLLLDDKNTVSKLHDWQTKAVTSYDIDKVGSQISEIYRQAIAINSQRLHT